MKNWNKKNISSGEVEKICSKYKIDSLTASILVRRNITEGEEIQYFLEKNKRFLHNPFEFSAMEDAVDRILQAKDEGEIVRIFGDRDVDGISSTTILYDYLKSLEIDVDYMLPTGNDGYGLSLDAVEKFYAENATLIITVDCGISNNEEIKHAYELGIDVIVLDHHNPPEELPESAIIINPKCRNSGYPFSDISGAAVVFKVVSALRFAKTSLYKQEICLLSAKIEENTTVIQCLKTENLVEKDFLEEKIEGPSPISHTKLIGFLQGQQIFVWDGAKTKKILEETFGKSVEFNFFDLRTEIAKILPKTAAMTLSELKSASKIAKYNENQNDEIHGFFNAFITFVNSQNAGIFPKDAENEEKDLQLVALAAIADIMPLKNENRILVQQGVDSLNRGKCRPGLLELLSQTGLLGNRITSKKLSWYIVPVLNATGRLGQPELGMKLFLEKDPKERVKLAAKIVELNEERKILGSKAWEIGLKQAEESIPEYSGKLCLVIDERINRGVAGILAGKLVQEYKVPSIAVSIVENTAIGSIRSCRGFSATPLLDKMDDILLAHGGHNYAAGFSLEKTKIEEFKARLKELSKSIELEEDDSETVEVDAELPQNYLNPKILSIIDKFEPYGESNPELTFLSKNLMIQDAMIMGKTERRHLKLTLDCGASKWPAIFWGEGDRLHRDFDKGDRINILFQIQRNSYNMNETSQIMLEEIYSPKQ